MIFKKRFLAGFALLILLALSGTTAYLFYFRDYSVESVLSKLTTNNNKIPASNHIDEELGFSFEYPKTWKYIEDWDLEYRNKNFVAGVMHQDDPGVACGVIVDERVPELKYKPEVAIRQLDQTLSENLGDFRSLGGRGFEFKKVPAIDYSYNYTREGTSIYVRLHQYLIYAPEKVYNIACASRETKYNQFKSDFAFIMRSFEVRR